MTDNHTTEPDNTSDAGSTKDVTHITEADTYEVGKNKPPKAHQFQAGQSGNPKGRPKGSRNINTIVKDIADEKVTVNIKGEAVVMSTAEAMVRNIALAGLKGNLRAQNDFLKLLYASEIQELTINEPFLDTSDDQIIFDMVTAKYQSPTLVTNLPDEEIEP